MVRDGRVAQLENVYIRGSKIRFLILPDMLKNAPMFKRQGAKAASSGPASGRGKSAILRAQGKLFVMYFTKTMSQSVLCQDVYFDVPIHNLM